MEVEVLEYTLLKGALYGCAFLMVVVSFPHHFYSPSCVLLVCLSSPTCDSFADCTIDLYDILPSMISLSGVCVKFMLVNQQLSRMMDGWPRYLLREIPPTTVLVLYKHSII